LGEEFYGESEENVRPWYYSWSLLCRYIPAGSDVFGAEVTGNDAIKSTFIGKEGKYTIAILNVSDAKQHISLQSNTIESIPDCKQYIYSETTLLKSGDHELQPNRSNFTLNLGSAEKIVLPPNSLVVYTNIEY